jgi:phosphohistidine phosphatase
MNTLVIIRHSKSSWEGPEADHDRPLSERGFRDADAIATAMRTEVGRPDLVLCSTALRARQTATFVDVAFFDDRPEIRYDPRIYDASVLGLLQVLHEVPAQVGTLALVGHNPGCADLASLLVGSGDPGSLETMRRRYKTSAIAVLDFPNGSGDFAPGSAALRTFIVPRG